jgi:glutathionylspermidine synthase
MIKTTEIKKITKDQLEEIGISWHTDRDGTDYIENELVNLTYEEAEAYFVAGNDLYEMFIEAGDYIVENNLFHEIGIPFNLVDTIKFSWENDPHWHLYGRFDLAGGIDGKPIKLIEFNADTPTNLLESSVIQWGLLHLNDKDGHEQFNNIHNALVDNFRRLITLETDVSEESFKEEYAGFGILFSSVGGIDEERKTVEYLKNIAEEAGFRTDYAPIDEVLFSTEGVFNKNEEQFEYWFKLYPWENISFEEPRLAMILEKIVLDRRAIVLNPAYTLMFQSKGFLKILYDLFPDSEYLLETSFEPLKNKKQIEKKFFGREGENIKILDENQNILFEKSGEYESYPSIFQEFVDFPENKNRNKYQAGLFFAFESCGVAFRKTSNDSEIMDNMSKFVGHIIEKN